MAQVNLVEANLPRALLFTQHNVQRPFMKVFRNTDISFSVDFDCDAIYNIVVHCGISFLPLTTLYQRVNG